MTLTPQVTVVTPTKNRAALLRETMDSVAAQTLLAWEHIIVDDGSDDDTADMVRARAERDPRVRYIGRTGEKSGANVCRNIGIAQSRSDLLVFLDSDDLLDSTCLERRTAIMARNLDIDFATFQVGLFDSAPGDLSNRGDEELLGDSLLRFLYFESPWQTTAPIWRKTALQRLGGFDEDLPSWQDVDLHVRAIAGGLRFLRFSQVDYHFRWRVDATKISFDQHRSPHHLAAAQALFEKFERVIVEGPGMDWVRRRALCGLYFFVAEMWLERGDLSAALRAWRSIRERRLGSRFLFASGAGLLLLKALGPLGRTVGGRLAHKWKGWVRMRTNPELVK